MLKYTIHFIDGGVLKIKGTIEHVNNVFLLYGEDRVIKYIIMESQIKYIEAN